MIPIALKVLAEGDSVRILFISSVAILAAVMDIFKTRKTSEQDLSQPFTVLLSFSLSPHSLSSISPHIFRSSFFPLSPLSLHVQVFLLYSHSFFGYSLSLQFSFDHVQKCTLLSLASVCSSYNTTWRLENRLLWQNLYTPRRHRGPFFSELDNF